MWLEYFKAFSGPGMWLVGLLGSALMLWISSKTASKADLEKIEVKLSAQGLTVASNTERLNHIEELFESAPTRQELQEDISRLAERIAALEASISGVGKQIETLSAYLHSLVEKGLR